jgi:proteic killer suppression protein
VEFSYRSNGLRRQLENAAEMDKAFGVLAKILRRRLAVLKEARCLADVPSGPPDRCHLLSQDRKGQFAVMLSGNWRLVFRPNHDPVPVHPKGGLDLGAITAIEFLEVVDYHKK